MIQFRRYTSNSLEAQFGSHFSEGATTQLTTLLLLALFTLLGGCATEVVRPGEQPQASQTVRMGVVEGLRDVQIDSGARPTGAGAAIGAVVGGVAGTYVGSGRGSVIGTVIGSVLGGLGGSHVEQAAGRRAGLELTVRLDEGRTMVIAQAQGDGQFKPGDRVRVVSDGATAHVYHQ